MTQNWRRPSEYEARLFRKMLGVDFPGNSGYRLQAEHAVVREMDEEEQLEFQIRDQIPAVGIHEKQGALVEAFYRDSDGLEASFILHSHNGYLYQLEKLKLSLSPIVMKQPPIDSLRLSPFPMRPTL